MSASHPQTALAVTIRRATAHDEKPIWSIFHAVVAPGDTWFFEPTIGRDDALAYWFAPANRCFVAEREGTVVGTYILKPNHAGLGSHVANAGFMVAPGARGSGVGRSMGEHALEEARRLGFRAMQFNFVVSSNEPALRLWQALGFRIVGTLPGAFRHARKGFVDACVMYRSLVDD